MTPQELEEKHPPCRHCGAHFDAGENDKYCWRCGWPEDNYLRDDMENKPKISRILKDGIWISVPDGFEFDVRSVEGIEITEILTKEEIEKRYGKQM